MNRNSQTNNHSKQQSSQCKKKPGCRQLVSLSPFPQPLLFFGLSERFFFQRGVKWQFDFKAQGRELISCCCNKDCWSSLIPYIIFKLLFILPLFLLYTILIIFWPALSLFRNLQHCRWEVNQQRPTDLLLRDQLPKTTQTWPGWVGEWLGGWAGFSKSGVSWSLNFTNFLWIKSIGMNRLSSGTNLWKLWSTCGWGWLLLGGMSIPCYFPPPCSSKIYLWILRFLK